ncbi:MAG: AMP-binding protein [Candidatus Tectomicrobia bacterium]|nr:AMP-binding protein [Candidatus Tectomicrobia bacterium]
MARKAPTEPIYYDREVETMPREQKEAMRLQKLRSLLEHLLASNGFYGPRLKKAGVRPQAITSIAEFRKRVPATLKQELVADQEENPPYGKRLGVPEEQLAQIFMTSGTSGIGQEVSPLSKSDTYHAALGFAFQLNAGGLAPGDISAHMWPVATMPGGLAALEGLRMLKTNPMILGIFDTKKKLQLMVRFNVHHLFTTPAYLTRLALLAQEMGIEPRRDLSRLKAITLSTEAFPPIWAHNMEAFWGVPLQDCYGSTQLGTVFAFTTERGVAPGGARGVYHTLDHMGIVEIVDPQSGEEVPYGEYGEPIVTPLWREASPVLRFRSGDRVRRLPPTSEIDGRTCDTWEMGTISRLDDMIKMKATNIWPSTIDEVLFAHAEIDEYNGRVLIDAQGRERVQIKLEFKTHITSESVKQAVLAKLPSQLREKTGMTIEVEAAPFGTIERFEYKARRWKDERMSGLEGVRFRDKAV